jgi:aldehyde:ferredoxin oxidoreductase
MPLEGVLGRILSVDLSKGLIGEERLPDGWYRDALGGLGVGMKYLLEDVRSKKPLLDDPIIVMTGPLTGNPLPGTSKASLISYRRDTRQLRLSTLEGRFPAYLKLAGFDGLVITGKAKEPVSLHLSQNHSKILDASPLWGKEVLTLDGDWKGNGDEGSILTIGPAGENGNPYANVISDRWVHGGAGMGRDFGLKRLKLVFVEPDSELRRSSDERGIPSWMISYLQEHLKENNSDEIRRSCFGCVKCCGRYDFQDDLFFLEEDIEKLQTLVPQWTREYLRHYYRGCLNKGLDPWGTAGPIVRMGTGKDISETLERFIGQPRIGQQGDCIDTQSWEEAHLSLQGWYRDGIFENVWTVPELVERENWAVVKNCIPVCERWKMSPEEMVFFLNQVTGSDYSQEDLLNIGETLTHEVMNLYHSLGYLSIDPQGIRFCGHHFPSFFGAVIGDYLAHRKWEKTGFPEKS